MVRPERRRPARARLRLDAADSTATAQGKPGTAAERRRARWRADGRPGRRPAHRARAARPYGAGPSSAAAVDVAATVVRFGTPTPRRAGRVRGHRRAAAGGRRVHHRRSAVAGSSTASTATRPPCSGSRCRCPASCCAGSGSAVTDLWAPRRATAIPYRLRHGAMKWIAGAYSADRQPRRDRRPGRPRLPGRRPAQRRRLRRARPGRRCTSGWPTRRSRWAAAPPRRLLPGRRQAARRRAPVRRRRGAPRLRLPSENADFAQAVLDAGLTWIGPPPQAIRELGDKVAARHIAAEVGAPLVPGTKRPGRRRRTRCVAFAERARPAGGDQGGVRRRRARPEGRPHDGGDPGAVRRPRSARRWRRSAAASASSSATWTSRGTSRRRCWPTSTARSIVVGTRDCSLQRRHQKLVEEAPAPFLTDEQRAPDPHRGPGHLRGGRVRRRGHGRVPRRPGRVDLVPRGQHPAAGRAPGDRGDQRDRPGPGAVPRSPPASTWPTSGSAPTRAARALVRVPDQRRGPRARLPARARHGHRLRGAGRSRGAGRLRRRDRLGGRRGVRLAAGQDHRHRGEPGRGAGAGAAGAGRDRGRGACRPCCRSTARWSATPTSPTSRSACTPGGSRPSGDNSSPPWAGVGRGRGAGRAGDRRRRGRREAAGGHAAGRVRAPPPAPAAGAGRPGARRRQGAAAPRPAVTR